MLGFLNKLRKKRLTFEQLQIIVLVTQQVVLSIDGTVRLPGAEKKALALDLLGKILHDMDLVASESLLDAVIESAVKIIKALDEKVEDQARPRYQFNLSGRPQTGN